MVQRPQITRITPTRLQDCEVIGDNEVTVDGDLVHFKLLADTESINHNESLRNREWKVAMIEELQIVEKNNTWELVKLSGNAKIIKVKWVYKLKHNLKGSIFKHKVGMVARGFLQRTCIDYY